MEAGTAPRVPHGTPLLAAKLGIVSVAFVLVPDRVASTSAVCLWLAAEGTVVSELLRAVLPANRAHTIVVVAALRIAKGAVLFLVSTASGDDFADTSAVGILPAV